MRYRIPGLLLAVLFLASGTAMAERRVLDLSRPSPGFDPPVSVSKGPLTVDIINRIPGARYRLHWEIGTRPIPPLPLPTQDAAGLTDGCRDAERSVNALNQASSEEEVARIVSELPGAFQDCDDRNLHNRKDQLIARTREQIQVELGYESELRVEVVRLDNEGKELKRWEAAYRSPDSGEWFVSYGFTFLPNNDVLFFSDAIEGEAGKFRITRKTDNREHDFAPAIFYAWMPEALRGNYASFSLAGGLGFDLSDPVVFLGPAVTIRHNLTIVAGVVMHKERRLSGEYNSADVITESLSEEQLHEETYKPTWFAGLSFRFDSRPDSHKPKSPEPAGAGAAGENPGTQ